MPSEKTPPSRRRQYYSVRSGKIPVRNGFSLVDFKRFFMSAYERMENDGMFQEWLGYFCVDRDFVEGKAGGDPELFVYRRIGKQGLWPIRANIDAFSEDDLFDVIEFLFDHASAGIDGQYHNFSDCGWHYTTFDGGSGKETFRLAINDVLIDYGPGFELSEDGEILSLVDDSFTALINAQTSGADPTNVQARIESAKRKYRRRGSTLDERRDAVRDLADVLEFVKEDARKVLKSKDSADLFNLANNFGIRHHNKEQKTDYDPAIWLSWMFYYYLATIHACVRLIEKANQQQLRT